ncbi:zinc ribbon domain-containing protein [Pseudobacteroides cellulosolvens]|nr:zinc ribbon domain-containing protein [Pseudobacteroides cellulosolvens]
MLCPNCNSEVNNDYHKCNYCGCDLSSSLENDNSYNQDTTNESYYSKYFVNTQQIKTQSRKSKKMIIAIVSVVLFFLAAIPLTYYLYNYVYLYNKQVSSVTEKVEVKNFNAAKISYDKIKNSKPYAVKTKVLSTVEKNLKDRVEVLSKSFIDDKVSYDELEKWFEGLSKLVFLKPLISEKEKSLTKIKDSKDNMAAAEEALKEKEYLEAISKYKLVIKDDSTNYKKSQNKINVCVKDMYDYYIDEAEKMSSDGKYEDAYKTVHSIESYYKEDTRLKSIEDGYLKKLLNDSFKKADALNSKKKFDDAISELEKISSYFPNNAAITKKVSTYRKNKIDAKVAEQERQEKRKKEIISKLTKGHDSQYGFNIYSPKGYSTKSVNITENINIEPRLYVGVDDYAALMLIAGFIRDSHIDFNKINFDVDGEIIEWPIGIENKKSQTGYDKVAEWCLLYYIHNTEMFDTVKKIAKAKKVTMIFEGKKLHKHILTAKEMENLKLFVELYGYYNHLDDLNHNGDYDVTEAI